MAAVILRVTITSKSLKDILLRKISEFYSTSSFQPMVTSAKMVLDFFVCIMYSYMFDTLRTAKSDIFNLDETIILYGDRKKKFSNQCDLQPGERCLSKAAFKNRKKRGNHSLFASSIWFTRSS